MLYFQAFDIFNSIFWGPVSERYFLGFSVSERYFLGHSEIPNSDDPCLYVCQAYLLEEFNWARRREIKLFRICEHHTQLEWQEIPEDHNMCAKICRNPF